MTALRGRAPRRKPAASNNPVKTALKPSSPWPASAVEMRPITSLRPYDKNARLHPDFQIAQIAESMRTFGFTIPVLVDETGLLIAGHGRLLAAKRLVDEGQSEFASIPVMTATGWTDAQRRAYTIADNRLNETSTWDAALLRTELGELQALPEFDFNALALGFDDASLRELFAEPNAGHADPDDAPEPPKEPVSRPGDVWLLGKHRLLCGDSTNADDVARVLAGAKPHLMVTDPPYGIGYDYEDHDDRDNAANALLIERVFGCVPQIPKVWTPGLRNLRRELKRFDAKVLVWSKGFAAAGSGLGGASTWEPILVDGRPPVAALANDVLSFKTDRETVDGVDLRKLHSCPKPVALYGVLVAAFSRRGQFIYEPFSGSGTTIIACEMEGRVCLAIEFSPAYVDVAVSRWQAFSGKIAVLEATGKTFAETDAERKAPPRRAARSKPLRETA